MMLDEVDKRILEVLEKDSRTPLRKISRQVKNTTINSVWKNKKVQKERSC